MADKGNLSQQQGCLGEEGELNDVLVQLPVDVLLLIMSSFTMNEVATISRVSRLWKKRLCGVFPRLNLRDSSAMKRISNDHTLLDNERSRFVARVNKVVEQHNGPNLEEFVVAFELDNTCQSDISKWVLFALQKGVKRLELDFGQASVWRKVNDDSLLHDDYVPPESAFPLTYLPGLHKGEQDNRFTLALDCCMLSNLTHTLTSLRLCRINIGSQVVECLLRSCTLLEGLYIQDSNALTSVIVAGSSVPLKRLKVSRCCNLKEIDISAPKLLSFTYFGQPVRLRIGNALALTNVSVSGVKPTPVVYALKSLSAYFSQLEYLSLRISLYVEPRLGIHVPALTNLKHLEFEVHGKKEETIRGWFRLIEMSPVLQVLTLKVFPLFYCSCYEQSEHIIVKHAQRPFTCLKTLKIVGFMGSYVDVVLAKYIIVNSMALDEVIVYVGRTVKAEDKDSLYVRVKELVGFSPNSPSLPKLTFKEPMENSLF